MPDLSIGEPSSLAVSDQTDSNGSFIVMLTRFTDNMGSWKLLIPAITNMDLSIGQTIAVADEEVIPQALVSPTEVSPVNRLGRAEWFAKMVNDDSLPARSIQ